MKGDSILLTTLSVLMASAGVLAQGPAQPAPQVAGVPAPTGERDLVVFVAQWRPELFRLVGQQPVPYGAARFTSPKAIVADPQRGCFYVFDEPQRLTETRKIWRIDALGNPTLVFQGHLAENGGPFIKPVGLGLDESGRVLVADAVSGLWRLEKDGQLQRLFDGQNKPLHKISAATATREYGFIIATSYQYEITGGEMLDLPGRATGEPPEEFNGYWSPTPSYSDGYRGGWDSATVPLSGTGVDNSTGRQVPIRIWTNQGGLFQVKPGEGMGGVKNLMVNQRPGGQEYDTYWRTAAQIFVDAAGRVVLVDAGSVRTRTEGFCTGAPSGDYPQTRTTKSVINGGVFLLHPDGRFEDLTFKTPKQNSGPMRRPAGAAQWSDDAYVVADPEMYVEGINGTGGLLLLKLDGSREARWPFGYQIKPAGVAILRGAGTAAAVKPVVPVSMADLAGLHIAGPITRIDRVFLERKPESNSGSMLPPLVIKWDEQPKAQAEQKLRSLFEGAQWSIADDGILHFCGRGVGPQEEGTPLVMHGKVTMLGQMANASASYQHKTIWDTQIGSVDARLLRGDAGNLTMSVTVNVFTNTERLKATFEQTMPLKRK